MEMAAAAKKWVEHGCPRYFTPIRGAEPFVAITPPSQLVAKRAAQ